MFKLLVEIGVMERLNALPEKEAENLKNRLRLLGKDPFPDGKDKKMIRGTRKTVYRLRSGNFRFFYIVDLENNVIKVTEFLTAEQAHKKYGRL